uniref:Transmembrane epididymal protein 1 n=1 Tax=Sciurus vulgaris TaxID=55149 RepID=A0A8D2CYP1_SCIVU
MKRGLKDSNDSLRSLCPPKNKGRWARLWKISCEGLLKIVAGSFFIIYVNSCTEGGMTLMNGKLPPRFMYPQDWQHLTMFTLLIINGCGDVISKNLLPQRCVALEKGALVLSSYELLLLLVSHVKESSGIELQVHSLLILVVFLQLLVLTAELWTPEMFHLWMTEAFLFVIMGSWLMQAGFILYGPVSGYPWEDDDMSDLMFVTTFFCWHVMFDALCLLAIYGFFYCWHRCYRPSLKMTESKEAPYHESSPEPLYRLLQEVEQPGKEDQAPLLAKSSP